MNEFKRKPQELLDFQQNVFDRDYMEFIVGVNELDFPRSSSTRLGVSSTEGADPRQFTAVMRRDALKDIGQQVHQDIQELRG